MAEALGKHLTLDGAAKLLIALSSDPCEEVLVVANQALYLGMQPSVFGKLIESVISSPLIGMTHAMQDIRNFCKLVVQSNLDKPYSDWTDLTIANTISHNYAGQPTLDALRDTVNCFIRNQPPNLTVLAQRGGKGEYGDR